MILKLSLVENKPALLRT